MNPVDNILLVEDNPGDARLLREMLVDELDKTGFRMRVGESLAEAMELLDAEPVDVVFLDLSLPDSFGLETLYRIQSKLPSLPVIVLTGNEDQQLALAAVKAGAQDFLVKNDLTGAMLVKTMKYARERKHIEESLRVSEARFRSLAELSSDWYWEQDDQHRLTYLSEGFQEKSGIDPASLIGRRWWELQAPIDGPWEQLRSAAERNDPFHDVVIRFGPSAETSVHVSISGVPLPGGYRGLGKDVSARERAAAALRGSEERYRQMMDAARDGILMLGASGQVSFANRRAAEMLGFEEGALHGVALGELLVDPAEATAAGAWQLRRRDGTLLKAVSSLHPVPGADGQHAGTLAILTDVSEFTQREDRVRELAALAGEKNEAERASAAKSRFLAAVSHDLRQPMHALGLFLDDLQSVPMPAPGPQLVGKMQAALEATQSLLDAILIMSRLESGMVAPNLMAFPLEPMMSRLRHAFGAVAQKKGLRFFVRPTAHSVRSDPALLERIVSNLVSNAIRYTDEGGVTVGVRRRGTDLRIEVWDTGPGIAAEHLDSIFREFYRIEGGGMSKDGLGLGLAIVKNCSDLLGHEVQVSSRPRHGSHFSVLVPQAEVPSGAAWGEPSGDDSTTGGFHGVQVLVVDDDPNILEGTSGLLRRWGCKVIAAASGPQAEAMAMREAQPPDLVVSDLRLDAGDLGTELITRLRARFRPNLPAVILTGDTSVATAREVRRSGLALLYKPVAPGKLRAVMLQQLQAQPEGSPFN